MIYCCFQRTHVQRCSESTFIYLNMLAVQTILQESLVILDNQVKFRTEGRTMELSVAVRPVAT